MWINVLHATHILDIIPALIFGFVVFLLGPFLVNWFITHTFITHYQRTLHKKDLEKRRRTLSDLYTSVWRILVLVGTAYYVFSLFFDAKALAPLFASAGIVGVAFGFGAQTLVKDFLTGVFIISENQFRVGDIIEIDGFGGTVERIGVRSTVMRDVDGNVHFFPNSMVQHVINKTMGYSMARFIISVALDTDIDKVSKIIDKIGLELAAKDHWRDRILEAPHFVMMGDFSSTSVNLIISGKTQPSDQWAVIAEMRRRILEEFETEDIHMGTGTSTLTHIAPAKKRR